MERRRAALDRRTAALNRRTFLGTVGATATAVLAGCSGGGTENSDGPYDGWASEANGFESVQELTGESRVEIGVGTGGGLGFDPVAVRISPGTEVVWEWTGKGGSHNVVAVDGPFESELTNETGHTFTHTFESTGVYRYVCEPHEVQGMKGVVEVVEG